MKKALSQHSTLSLNPSNHASIPPEGLELPAGVPTPVTDEQGAYLQTLGVEILDLCEPEPQPLPRKGKD